MTVNTTAATPMDEIVDRLKDHVWTLLRAQRVDAAMVLLAAEVDAFLQAQQGPEPTSQPEPAHEPEAPLEGEIVATGAELEAFARRERLLLSR